MRENGLLVIVTRGVYRLAEADPLNNADLIQVALRIPKGVICLISALSYHNLTKQIPHQVYVALPLKAHLLNQARASGRPLNEILQYYAIERFLYQLAQSPHARQFVLKGVLLFRA